VGERGREEQEGERHTAALPSVYFLGAPWIVPPPGVWRKRQLRPMISSFV